MHPNLLDQLHVFETIAEEGSFSAAAKRLNRTVSAVGYAIGQLEEQLELELFDRSAYRPTLTTEGEALLRDAEIITRKIDRFSARAAALKQDVAINATILVEPVFPRVPLATALSEFSNRHPQIQISVQERSITFIEQEIAEGNAELGLIHLNDTMPMRNFDGRQLTLREVMMVAAPDHPLSKRKEPFALSELDDYRQIILSDQAVDAIRYNYHVHVTDLWAVSNVDMMRELLLRGVGWGYMARNLVSEELKSGQLVSPPCKDVPDWAVSRFAAIWTPRKAPDSVLSEFIDLVELHCRQAEDAAYMTTG